MRDLHVSRSAWRTADLLKDVIAIWWLNVWYSSQQAQIYLVLVAQATIQTRVSAE